METLENNLLISQFLNWEVQTNPKKRWFGRIYHPNRGWIKVNELSFDNDWNDLMTAVDKIENLVFKDDKFFNFHILGGCQVYIISSKIDEFRNYSAATKLLTVYKAVVDFIKWYNQNKL